MTTGQETSAARPHISHSALNMLSICGEQYRRRYVCDEKIPPGIALLVGTGTHAGAEVNFTQKIDSHTDLPKSQIVEAAVAGYESALNNGYELSAEEKGRGAAIVIGEAKDQVVSLAGLHADEQAPDYQPVAVEHQVVIPFPHATHDLVGYIDLIDDHDLVVDFKTAGKSKSQSEADKSTQLTIYAAAFQRTYGAPPTGVRLDTLVKTKKPKRQVLDSTRSVADIQVLLNRVNTALRVIESGAFMPCDPGHWACSSRFCGFSRDCPYYNKERDAAAEANGE